MTTAWTTDAATGDAARAVTLTLLWGLDGVALRTLGGGRVPNVTEAPLRRRLDQAELPVLAVDPGLFDGPASARARWLDDLDALAETAAFCDRLGCGVVRVGALADVSDGGGWDPDAAADALRRAGDRADRHGLSLAVRNDAETAAAGGQALASLLSAVGHPAVGADWRPADAALAGEAPGDGLAALVDAGHVPTVVGVRDGRLVAGGALAVVGEGDLGWPGHLAALAAAGVAGPLVLDAVPDPVRTAGLASATALVQMARRAGR